MTTWKAAASGLIFAEDFDRPYPAKPPPEPTPAEPVYSAADLQAVRTEALRDGHAAGMADADGATQALARHALLRIAERLDTARTEAAAIAEETAEAVARLIMDAFAAAFPALCARHGEAELRAVVSAVLPRLHDEPAITIRANPRVCDALTQEIAAIDTDITDRVRIVPTDSLPLGDVRIAWRSGGAKRDTAGLWAEIEAVLAPAGLRSGQPGQETANGK